jgi:hypothetical protein
MKPPMIEQVRTRAEIGGSPGFGKKGLAWTLRY